MRESECRDGRRRGGAWPKYEGPALLSQCGKGGRNSFPVSVHCIVSTKANRGLHYSSHPRGRTQVKRCYPRHKANRNSVPWGSGRGGFKCSVAEKVCFTMMMKYCRGPDPRQMGSEARDSPYLPSVPPSLRPSVPPAYCVTLVVVASWQP